MQSWLCEQCTHFTTHYRIHTIWLFPHFIAPHWESPFSLLSLTHSPKTFSLSLSAPLWLYPDLLRRRMRKMEIGWAKKQADDDEATSWCWCKTRISFGFCNNLSLHHKGKFNPATLRVYVNLRTERARRRPPNPGPGSRERALTHLSTVDLRFSHSGRSAAKLWLNWSCDKTKVALNRIWL